MQNTSPYLRFLNTVDAKNTKNPGRALDAIEIQLLERILLSSDKGQTLLVGDLIGLQNIGSQATLHGRLKHLATLRYIKLTSDKADGRRKFVSPSKLAIQYAEFMSSCLVA